MYRMLWARFGEATLEAPHAVQWLSGKRPEYMAIAMVLLRARAGLGSDHDTGA
jgi:hypothetical protein